VIPVGYYTVLTPCVVGQLHYATIPTQPVKADDAVAAELVASGALAPYQPGGVTTGDDAERDPIPAVAERDAEPEPEHTPTRPRRRRSQG
jgi:hypothetical protein